MDGREERLDAAGRWELWNLRALLPAATPRTLRELRARRRRWRRLDRDVLGRGDGDAARLMADARGFFAAHPEIHTGLVLSLHVGPYSLLPALYLDAGLHPAVVLDAGALAELRPEAERRRAALGLSGRLEWISIDRPLFAGRILRALRAGRPVLVYLDGNSGAGGTEATRDRGMPYRLPGRTIRVRTGPGRLVQHAGCAVHGVTVRWREDGTLAWRAVRPGAWDRAATPRQVARQLYDWLFDEVARAPEQWTFWSMLSRSSEAFAAVGDDRDASPALRARRAAAFRLALACRPAATRVALAPRVEVWEPDILADPAGQRFWDAEGLRDAQLDDLRREEPPTLAALAARHGRAWVEFHVLRLTLLGLAELRAPS